MPKPPATSTNIPPESPSESDRLEPLAREFTDQLRRQFAAEIGRDPLSFKKRVLRFRRQLPPGRGRPRDPKTEAALELIRQGRTVSQVLRAQVPGFEQLDTWGRMLAEKALRQALMRRRRLNHRQNGAKL